MTAKTSSKLTQEQILRLASMPNGVLFSTNSSSFKLAQELKERGYLKSQLLDTSNLDKRVFYRFTTNEPVQLSFDFLGVV